MIVFHQLLSNTEKIINAKVSPGQTYVLEVVPGGNLSITKQAAHFSLSETGINENGNLIYKYIPVTGFQGNDEVFLLHKTEVVSDNYNNNSGCNYGGSHMSSKSVSIVVNLTVQ